ncbi:MAG: hypothetical protein LC776_18495 [Acidobacteria bacterium]|nr:hypothetical protein [Acidobacteriota bacterium]
MSLDNLFPSSNDPESLRVWYERNFVGTYRSHWYFLRLASASAFTNVFEAFVRILKARERGMSKNLPKAEIGLVLTLNYSSFVSGPALGAVLLPIFAIEAFISLCGHIALRLKSEYDAFVLAAKGLDDLRPFLERAKKVVELTGASPLGLELAKSVESLFQFRNSGVHDTPLFQAPGGWAAPAKWGKTKLADMRSFSDQQFPRLDDHPMPLSIRHARLSVEVHDHLVGHILERSDEQVRVHLQELLSPELRGFGGIMNDFAKSFRESFSQIEHQWDEEVIPWYESIPRVELASVTERLVRRSRIKLVSPEQADRGLS